VKLLAAGAEQRAVGRVLNERMLEQQRRIGRRATAKDKTCFRELFHGGAKYRVGPAGDGGQEIIGKLAPNDRPHLRRFLRLGREPVESRHERGLERRRH
jgi:hypothetical protein